MNLVRSWLEWRKRKSGEEIRDWDKGCGYYSLPKHGEEVVFNLQSGKRGVYKFLGSENYWDPYDMIEHAWFQFLGYEGEKRFADMTFREFRAYLKSRWAP